MNLVQINERLKDLPMQVVQQYANGMNPEVPPYLALGELQRREMSQKQMATAQGAAQGPQPSVKEQVEQKAGLMQLQQMQQQQMAQQMQQPRGPMPTSAGVPQPVDQPEVAMASGGLAAVPVRPDMFEYAKGGIIAFSGEDGSEVKSKYETRLDKLYRENREAAERRQRGLEAFNEQVSADPAQVKMREEERAFKELSPAEKSADRGRRLKEFFAEVFSSPPAAVAQAPMATPMRPVSQTPAASSKPASVSEAQATALAGPQARVPVGLPAALPKADPAATGPRPAPTAGLPAALPQAVPAPTNTSPFMAEAAAMARDKPVAPTPEGIIAEQNKLLPAAMQEAQMQKRLADQRARAEQERTAFERSRPSGLDDLIRVFGQAGQYKGLSGMAPAYTANIDRKRAEEAAMERRQNELMTAIEGREYEGAKELFGAREKSLTAANKSFQERLMTNTKTLAELAGVDQRRMDEAANRLNNIEVTKLREATQNRSLNEKLKFEADYLSLKSQARSLAEKGDAPGAAKLEARANDMLSIRSGGGGTAAVGAGRNAIMDRRQTMTELEKIIKDEGMMYSDAEKRQAASEYKRLAMMNVSEGSGGGNAFTVTAGGKTYTFPTQEAANKFKAEAGVK
jgi:hypothetical protein